MIKSQATKNADRPATGTSVAEKSKPQKDEWPIAVLRKNEHYYMENGFMVFTERYHSARGRCCGNACRHCPFEHVNVKNK